MKFFAIILLLFATNSFSQSHTIYNYSKYELESARNHLEVRPIASITKLFTAAAILEKGLDLDQPVEVRTSNRTRFPKGAMIPRIDLMKAMLISSDNGAADSLAHSFPGGYIEFINFVEIMINAKGLAATSIVDASGINSGNVSTADDLALFVWTLRNNEIIKSIASKANDTIEFEQEKTVYLNNPKTKSKKKKEGFYIKETSTKILTIKLRNTNPGITKYNILISKTGYTSRAKRCLVLLVEYKSQLYGISILGEPDPKSVAERVEELLDKI
jgi:D-alanyl-D-alanine carboxypeptidase